MLSSNDSTWIFEENGKLHFRQEQLFQLHRLTLVILGTTGMKFRYGTPLQLQQLLAYANSAGNLSVQTQLMAVLPLLPPEWRPLVQAS